MTFRDAKRNFERAYTIKLMKKHNGNITAAAREAGKDRKDFYDLLKRTGVDANNYRKVVYIRAA